MPPKTKPTKAIVAGVVYVAGWVTTALADGVITGQEWGAGAFGFLLAVGAVYGVKNNPA